MKPIIALLSLGLPLWVTAAAWSAADPAEVSERMGATIPLKMAEEAAAAHPQDPGLQIALAQAYCAHSREDQALRILEDPASARDESLRLLRARAFQECGEPQRAFMELLQILKTSSHTEISAVALNRMLALAPQVQNSRALRAIKEEWLAQVAAGVKEPWPYRLLAENYAWDGDPALETLCHDAIRQFPEDLIFYDLLAQSLLARGEWNALEALRADKISTLKRVPEEDYLELAEAYVLSDRTALAQRTLRQGLADVRLDPVGRNVMKEKIRVLDVLAKARPAEPKKPACSYDESGKTRSLDCGGQKLSYAADTGLFAGPHDPAVAASLARRLLEAVEESRFHVPGKAEDFPLSPDMRERLRQAGYLER